MKTPRLVADLLQAGAGSSDAEPAVVAKFIESIDPLNMSDVKYTVELKGRESGPHTYYLDVHNDFCGMSVFSESVQGKAAVEGRVNRIFHMMPQTINLEEYHSKQLRKRSDESKLKPKTKVLKTDDLPTSNRRPIATADSEGKGKEKANLKLFERQPKREPKKLFQETDQAAGKGKATGQLQDSLLKLFERQPKWALNQLAQETDQAANVLKEILNQLCVYNERESTYELKATESFSMLIHLQFSDNSIVEVVHTNARFRCGN